MSEEFIDFSNVKRVFEGFEEITWRISVGKPCREVSFVDYLPIINLNYTPSKKEKKYFKKLNQTTTKFIKDNNITFKY